ncbi:MAG: transposase [Oleiphilaceae bacterium]|nr:transposase [Oleiphilaceae bacterium]
MPRAHRVFLPGHVWHITHRCHRQQFLLQFARDRRRWRYWLYQARKRYGFCVLNYIATCNHVHLLVKDRGQEEIPRSMQLIASRTAQEFNQRKQRKGAYWEDRYHATAVDSHGYLARCLVYIDLNMVRAGKVAHPAEWDVCGYNEIQQPPPRYRVIDTDTLTGLLSLPGRETMRSEHSSWVSQALASQQLQRQGYWSDSLAVGGLNFVARYQRAMGAASRERTRLQGEAGYRLRENASSYNGHS